jgi:protein O-GlcNAc transferase
MSEPKLESALEHDRAGRHDEAEALYREVVAAEPANAEALFRLGAIALRTGRGLEAIEVLRRAIAINASEARFQCALGQALAVVGRVDEALGVYQAVVAKWPDMPEAHFEHAMLLQGTRQTEEAIAAYRRAIALRPDFAEARYNLAVILHTRGEGDQAIAEYRAVSALRPDWPDVWARLGDALRARGEFAAAVEAYERAIRIRPDHVGAVHNLGNAFQGMGNYEKAVGVYQQVVSLKPDLVEGYSNLGNALRILGRADEAAAAHRQALALRPGFGYSIGNLGNALKDLGQLDDAIACYRQAVVVDPRDVKAHSNLLFTLQFHPDYDAQDILHEHQLWNQTYARPLASEIRLHSNDRTPDRRLRVGYVSPNFESHCQAFYMVPLLAQHDRKQFEVFCYSDVNVPDAITAGLRKYADIWRETGRLSDSKLAESIRADGIDVLVDLTMHMASGRPLVFARKPAPVQVTWLAYPGTTGLTAMDYRLTDPVLDPPGVGDRNYTETSIRLPHTFWCMRMLTKEPSVNALPALSNGAVTFGCLNTFCKVNEGTLALWAKVVTAVPGSRLLMLVPSGSPRPRVLAALAAGGVDPSRVEFVDRQSRPAYLETYRRIDIGLDTTPYNGHTTSIDSYWMGVPVVTLIGQTVTGRAGLSQLSNLDLRDLAGRTKEEFVRIAVKLAGDLDRLSKLRASLRERVERSPLMDTPRFAHNIESAYRLMWQRWCKKVRDDESSAIGHRH